MKAWCSLSYFIEYEKVNERKKYVSLITFFKGIFVENHLSKFMK